MKELSTEEKAKAYDEALETAKYYLNALEGDVCVVLEEVFPELKESEDEKIRKEIIAFLTYYHTGQGNSVKYDDDWIAWLEKQGDSNKEYWRGYREGKKEILDKYSKLEKQGEQKPAWSEEDEKMLSDIDNCIKNLPIFYESLIINGENKTTEQFICDAINWLKSFKDRVQPQTHHAWSEEDMNLLNRLIGVLNGTNKEDYHEAWEEKFLPWLKFLKDRVQPQPKWSEEDEKHLKLAIDNFQTLGNSFLTSWLKSLKDRVQPQPKQEWSEEDKKMSRFIGNAITVDEASMYLESKGIQVIDAHVWLDGLKDRVQPQNTWKPSDEQMNAFDAVLVYNPPCSNECRNHLITLYNELKKLKG